MHVCKYSEQIVVRQKGDPIGDDYGLVHFNLLLYIVFRSESSSRFRERV